MINKPEDITAIFTTEGKKKITKGQILVFNKDGQRTDLKITKISKGRVWAKEVKTYDLDEVAVFEKKAK